MSPYRKNLSRLAAGLLAVLALLFTASCGGYGNGSGSSSTVSKFKRRILVLNAFVGTVVIVDADKDLVWQIPISIASRINKIIESPDKTLSVVASSTTNGLYSIDNAKESATGIAVGIGGATDSMAFLSDNKTVVAAVRNAIVTNAPVGAVQVVDISAGTLSATISVPEARRIAVNNARTKVLAFADDSNSVYVIDTTAKTATPIAGFDRPVTAVFSSDDSKAYILNCGVECGGTTASVQVMNMSDNSLGANVPVNGATAALLDNNKLYVAGTANNLGQLDVIDTATMTRTQNGIAITDGFHNIMAMGSGGKLFIGAQNCSGVASGSTTQGCLSIFDTSGTTAKIAAAPGSVTGMQPVNDRNLMYVTIGGELVIYDTTKDAPFSAFQLDIVGDASDVKLID